MASRDTGKLAGKSGVIGNQRQGYKEQMARMRMEQSKRVTCAAGQKNASAKVAAGPIGIPLLWQALMALGTSALIVAGVLIAVVVVVGVVYLAATLLSQGKSKKQDEEDGDTVSDTDVAPSESGTPSSGQDNNNEPIDLVELAKTALQKTRNTVKTAKAIENVIRGGTATGIGEALNIAGTQKYVLNSGYEIKVSPKKMYQLGNHYNDHGRTKSDGTGLGYASKKDYEKGAREFIEQNVDTAEIYEGKWNGKGVQNGEIQIIIRKNGKQAIINKATGQIIDFYKGTDLKGFIKIRRIQ